MSNYIGYKLEDNIRRKENNLTDQLPELGSNQNVKCYSTKPGQLSRTSQVQKEHAKYQALNRRQPVRGMDDLDPAVVADLKARYAKIKIA